MCWTYICWLFVPEFLEGAQQETHQHGTDGKGKGCTVLWRQPGCQKHREGNLQFSLRHFLWNVIITITTAPPGVYQCLFGFYHFGWFLTCLPQMEIWLWFWLICMNSTINWLIKTAFLFCICWILHICLFVLFLTLQRRNTWAPPSHTTNDLMWFYFL